MLSFAYTLCSTDFVYIHLEGNYVSEHDFSLWFKPNESFSQFSAPDLSEIARNLDELEAENLEDTDPGATSHNMDDTGVQTPLLPCWSGLWYLIYTGFFSVHG